MSPGQRLHRVLFLVAVVLVALGVTGAANPAPEDTYTVDDADVTTEEYAGLSTEAQRVVENGSGHNVPVTVEPFPEEFGQNGVTVVRYEGELICAQSGPVPDQPSETRPGTNQTGIVGNCDDSVYEFDSLSSRGKSVVSETLDSSSREMSFNRESPPEFSTGQGDEPFVPEGEYGSGVYYVIRDDTVYRLTISDAHGSSDNALADILLIFSGLGVGVYGLVLYARSQYTSE
jgi:hypothetical protein